MSRDPFPKVRERLYYAVAVGCVGFVVAFWLFDLPGSPKGRWADVLCSVLLLGAAWTTTLAGLMDRRDRAYVRSLRH